MRSLSQSNPLLTLPAPSVHTLCSTRHFPEEAFPDISPLAIWQRALACGINELLRNTFIMGLSIVCQISLHLLIFLFPCATSHISPEKGHDPPSAWLIWACWPACQTLFLRVSAHISALLWAFCINPSWIKCSSLYFSPVLSFSFCFQVTLHHV